jgi:hypothetical protein
MCYFITLIVPTADTVSVGRVMKSHGRIAEPVNNPSVQKVTREPERQFLTTSRHCDCGSVLANHHSLGKTPEQKVTVKLTE